VASSRGVGEFLLLVVDTKHLENKFQFLRRKIESQSDRHRLRGGVGGEEDDAILACCDLERKRGQTVIRWLLF